MGAPALDATHADAEASETSASAARPSASRCAPIDAAARPAMGSAMASPTNIGGSPGTTRPPEAAASSPKAIRLLSGPRRPCPVIETQAVPAATTSSTQIPHCCITRGLLASSTRSAPAISSRNWPTAPGAGKSRLTRSLRPFSSAKNPAGPRRAPSGRDPDSTLSTRQPASASSPPASGPAHRLVRSTTTGSERRGRAGTSS